MRFSASLIALLASSALALPSANHVIHEKRSEAASFGLAKKGAAPAGQLMPMKVALTQKNLHQIPQLLHDVSDPSSPNFGKHWTGDELARKFGPAEHSVKAVKGWLAAAGIRAKVSANRHWVEFEATVEQAEKLLRTKYHIYDGKDGSGKSNGKEHIGCDDYSLPGHIGQHVDFITPTISVSELRRSVSRRAAPAAPAGSSDPANNLQHTHFRPVGTDGAEGAETPAPPTYHNGSAPSVSTCAQGATPDCFRALYGIPHGTTATMGNPLGIYESEDYYDQQDLDLFFTAYAPEIVNGTAPMLNSIDGGDISGGPGEVQGESVLDLQVAYPLIHPQGVRLLQVDDAAYQHSAKHGHFDSLLDALDASFCSFMGGDNSTYDFTYPDSNQTDGYNGTKMCGTFTPPTVISISYGYQEDYFSAQYLKRQCLEFAKLAMAGSTIVASSGDSGLSAPYCANPKLRVSTPQFPASCPYVTTVGATMLDQTVGSLADEGVEVVATDSLAEYKAGAGFSTVFDMPEWQKEVVGQYLASVASSNSSAAMQPGVNFNPSGRAYPDVSALGTNITTITNNRAFLADGTSASAPLFASMITLINEERMGQGKGPVGFINPALYKAGGDASVFRDVTKGDNAGCGMPGFKATKGWDATTGWGTPKYAGLRDLLVSLP